MRRTARPVLITDAERSPSDQLRSREIRYVVMMGIRALCVILAGVLVGLRVPMLWLWLLLCAVAMALLPWLAVILANDRPPKEQHRLGYRKRRGPASETPPLALPAPRTDPPTIDADP